MIKLVWKIERPKYRKVEVVVNQKDGFHFRINDTKQIHPAIPSEHVRIKFPNIKEAEAFINNVEAILTTKEGIKIVCSCFNYAWLNGKRMQLPYTLKYNVADKKGVVILNFSPDLVGRNLPGSASGLEFKITELKGIVGEMTFYFFERS